MYRGLRALLGGNYGVTDDLVRQAQAIGLRAWPGGHLHFGLAVLQFTLFREQARFEQCEGVVSRVVDLDPTLPVYWRTQQALLEVDTGRVERAHDLLDQLAAHEFSDIYRGMLWLGQITQLAELTAVLDDAARAETLYELLSPYAGSVAHLGSNCLCFGSISHHLGMLATTLTRWDAVEQHFRDALKMDRQLESPPFVAHTQYAWADMLVRRGRPEDQTAALDLIGQALTTAESLGMQRLANLALALKVRVQGILNA
jgi:hypothetical protein